MPRTTTTLSLKTPRHAGRASFAIVRRDPDGTNQTLKSDALKAINTQFKAGKLSYNEALEAAKRELERLKRTVLPRGSTTTLRPANLRLVDKYWQEVCVHKPYKNERARQAAYNRLIRAIGVLGDTPLTADRNTMQRLVNQDGKDKPTSRQRTIVGALNQLLLWMGRGDIKLSRTPKEFPDPKYLTLREFRKVVRHVEEPYRSLFWTLFATGCRVGEAFALEDVTTSVWIPRQMNEAGEFDSTKNRKRRRAPIIPEGKAGIEDWLDVSEETKREIRLDRIAEILTKACEQEFESRRKHLTCRDLRHCYAIHLISRGVSLSMVAQALGDSIQVTQEYYAGFALGDEALDVATRLLGG